MDTVLAAAIAVALAGPAVAPATAAAPGDALGVYHGPGDVAGVADFERRLGRSGIRAHDYLDRRSWAAMVDVSWLARRWREAGRADGIVLSVPMLPDDGGTLAEGSAGAYNRYFRAIAERLVAEGLASAVLRLGWEFNGAWYRWTIAAPDGGASYAAFWRQIVRTMRSVPGAAFRFEWCPVAGSSWLPDGSRLEAASAWPGDEYVDYVGLDLYDQSWIAQRSDPGARWRAYVGDRNGLAWHATFARAHGKPMTFSEWALADRLDGHGGGDAPTFVDHMHDWIAAHPVAYHLYYEHDDSEGNEFAVFSGRFPQSAERFVQRFGAPAPAQGSAPPPPLPAPGPPPGSAPSPSPSPPLTPAPPPPPSPVPPAPSSVAASVRAPPAQGLGGWLAGDGAKGGGVPSAGGRRARASSLAEPGFAKLRMARARIVRRAERLDVLAPISRRASGRAAAVLHAAGRRTRVDAEIDSRRARIRFSAPIPAAQARLGTGIVTLVYRGDADTRPQRVRLRAASRPARLVSSRPRVAGGRLRVAGRVSARARGVVRVELTYVVGARSVVRSHSAAIAGGRWRLDVPLSPRVLDELGHRRGAVQSTVAFTGYARARMRGEMRSYQVLGER